MKVLFLTNIPSPYRVKFFSLLGEKCKLTVIYELEYATNRDKKWKVDIKKTYKEIFLNAKRTIYDGGISFKIFKYLNEKYDFIIVGTHGTPTAKLAMLYMRLRNIPYILNLDGGLTYTLTSKSKTNLFFRKVMFRGAKYYLTTNEESKKYLSFFGIKRENIFKYRFSSIFKKDIEKINQEKKLLLKRYLNIKEEKVVLSVGQFIYRKGFDVLLKSKKYLGNDVGFYIIGGKITEEYRKILNDNNLKNVYFLDFKTKEELDKYYQISDIFVLPTRHDEWGLVINEALAKGLPIITTNHCGAGLELIKNYENGFILDVEDYYSLGKKINEILNNDKLKNLMRNNNYKLASEYTLEKMAIDHIDILENI